MQCNHGASSPGLLIIFAEPCISEVMMIIMIILSRYVLYLTQHLVIYRGGAAKFGLISITYHKYILGVHKYISRLEISTFDRENH